MNRAFLWSLPCLLLACEGPAGPLGPEGPAGDPGGSGQDGPGGADGQDGQDGEDGRSPWLTGPGLRLEVQSADIAGDGTVTATFQVTDAAGTPLDLDGVYTEGAVSPRFILAWLDQTADGEALSYTAYTTQDETSPITDVTETQAATDSGGSFAEVDFAAGTYAYEFGTKVTSPVSGKTHTLGVYATRTVDDTRYVANATFDFVPDGSAVEVTREVVDNDACNRCHNPISAHGGSRRDIDLCILCHSPQTVDADTGNTVDFPIMIHKIHRGADLDQVAEGEPYEIIGHNQRSHDYSTVHFPQALQRCEACHTGADGDVWKKQKPSKSLCSSCHDGISFVNPPPEGKVLHSGGAQPDDAPCEFCHPETGSLAGMIESHYTPATDPASPTVELDIVSVESTAPEEQPEMTFTVMVNGAPRDISTEPLASLRATVAGPTTDYRDSWQVNLQSEGTLIAEDASAGLFRYVFPAAKAMPEGATGTYAFGMEGYLQPGGSGPRFAAFNPIAYAAVTDASPEPRRQVVYENGCNDCHFDLAAHGGGRKNPQYCIMCHNPESTGAGRVSRLEETVVAEPIDFKVMIHKIHRGEDLVQDYVLGGYPPPNVDDPLGSPIDFTHLRFPGDLRACWSCHAANTFGLPLAQGVLASRSEILTCEEEPGDDENDYCEVRSSVDVFTPPTSAVCTSCHDGPSTAAHAEIMTTMSGAESCTTCHGPGAVYDSAAAHALDP